jgi:hypothetical protein
MERKCHYQDLGEVQFQFLCVLYHNLYVSPNVIWVIKSRRMRWRGHAARMVDIKMHIKFCSENLKGRDRAGDLGIDGKIILEWIVQKNGRVWSVCTWLRIGTRGGLL